MTDLADIAHTLRLEMSKFQTLNTRYDGALREYSACSQMGNGTDADIARQNLHIYLDQMLDSISSVHIVQTRLLNLTGENDG